MKKIAALFGVAAASTILVGCNVDTAPLFVEAPDPAVFLEQTRAAAPSLSETDAQLLAEGDAICAALGESDDAAAELLIDHLYSGDFDWTRAETIAVWDNASAYLCPRSEQFGMFLMQ